MKYIEAKEFLKEGMRVKTIIVAHHISCKKHEGMTERLFKNSSGESFRVTGGGSHEFEKGDELEILTEADGITPWKDPRVEKLPFEIGQRVTVQWHGSTFTGKFRGQCTNYKNDWAIERDDGEIGGAQNDWYSVEKDCPITLVEEKAESKYKVGMMVRATRYCSGSTAGQIYELEEDPDTGFQLKGTNCNCGVGWEIVEPALKSESFQVGDRVKFKGQEKEKSIPWDYVCDPEIPREMLKHGSTFLGKQYEAEFARVTGFYKEWILVEYISRDEKPVCLGFNSKNLEKVEEIAPVTSTFTTEAPILTTAAINSAMELINQGAVYHRATWTIEDFKPGKIREIKPRLFNRKPTKMNNIFQAIKAKLNPTDRELVKHGYLNADGTRTGMYEMQLKEMADKKMVDAEDTKEFRKELAKELNPYKEDKE